MKHNTFLGLAAIFIFCFARCSQPSTPESINRVVIDLEKQREMISTLIYGQFIEHLGRCIYGGIWAEMLRDRKFYYPITTEYTPWDVKTDPYWNTGEYRIMVASPWKELGPPGSVQMDSLRPWVGQHDPEIFLNGGEAGVAQPGLYFEKGREYEGYIYLASNHTGIQVTLSIEDEKGNSMKIIEVNDMDAEYKKVSFQFTPEETFDPAIFRISGSGQGSFRIGTVSLMPADHVQGFNREVLSLIRELNAPIYRWPGGNFVSGYNWKDGIGDRDRRPPRKNPAWTGIESNDVGIHEYMDFCELVNTEPFICVNTGLGTVKEVADQVEYCNGSVESPMGKWRAENGHPLPYSVKYWAVGNEMYGDWQLGHMPLSAYVEKHKRVAEAMQRVDPGLVLVAVGNAGEWSRTMLAECRDHMDLISEHIYCKELDDPQAHIRQIPDNIRRVAEIHRNYRDEVAGLAEKNIRIAMDEWNYWHGDYLYGELGCRYYLKDALGIAAGFHEFYRNSDLYFMANYAQTVNVIGAIKTTDRAVEFATTGIVLKLYRNHYGQIPVECLNIPEPLDIEAAIDTTHNLVTLSVINPGDRSVDFNLAFTDGQPMDVTEAYIISNPDPMAYNSPEEGRPVDARLYDPENPDYFEVSPYTLLLIKFKR